MLILYNGVIIRTKRGCLINFHNTAAVLDRPLYLPIQTQFRASERILCNTSHCRTLKSNSAHLHSHIRHIYRVPCIIRDLDRESLRLVLATI